MFSQRQVLQKLILLLFQCSKHLLHLRNTFLHTINNLQLHNSKNHLHFNINPLHHNKLPSTNNHFLIPKLPHFTSKSLLLNFTSKNLLITNLLLPNTPAPLMSWTIDLMLLTATLPSLK